MPLPENANLAEPAPRVGAATVSRVHQVGPATAEPVSSVEAATARPCDPVEAATTSHKPPSQAGDSLEGLTTKQLRGSSGADFECYCAVLKGACHKNFLKIALPCLYDERDFVAYGEVKYYILVKHGLCYVFVQESDPSPLYAIELELYNAVLEDHNKPEKGSWTISPVPNTNLPRETMKTVLLKRKRDGKQAFQFTFDTEQQPNLHKIFLGLFDGDKKKSAVTLK